MLLRERPLEREAHSEKFMNVSDMQVPDEDDRHDEQSRSKTIKANSKIVRERIWTLNFPRLANKTCDGANLDTDTDAHLHDREC